MGEWCSTLNIQKKNEGKNMLHPVKVFKPTKEGLELIKVHTSKELQERNDKNFKEHKYIHPSVRRRTRKEIEAHNAGLPVIGDKK